MVGPSYWKILGNPEQQEWGPRETIANVEKASQLHGFIKADQKTSDLMKSGKGFFLCFSILIEPTLWTALAAKK